MTSDNYWDHVSDAASVSRFQRNADAGESTISAETVPENSSLLDFSEFARECPDKLFELLAHLRVEFQELFYEYYVLHKSQSFIAKTHGFIQTRCWQNLRVIEQALGALIVLGPHPSEETLRPVLEKAGLETTEFGSLTSMIVLYSTTQDYTKVAKSVKAPVPAIRKIFRPAITTLLASDDLKASAVGAFLRNLTHHASLTGAGLSRRCRARITRVKTARFDAPSPNNSPLTSYGATSMLHDTPWMMFEISSECRMATITPLIQSYGKRLFGKKAAQIFAPLDAAGELQFGYILARSTSASMTRALTRLRGISDMAAKYNSDGDLTGVVTVPDADVQKLIAESTHDSPHAAKVGDFVRITTGDARGYCGLLRSRNTVQVDFPSGRQFIVTAENDALEVLRIPAAKRAFWGSVDGASERD